MILQPKNWVTFQHYKDRNPPWIKLHKGLLNKPDFMSLSLASVGLANMLWLLASETKDGCFDGSMEHLTFRLRKTEREIKINLKCLIDKGFFIIASTVQADDTESPSEGEAYEPEGEVEGEAYPVWLDEQTMKDFIAMRKQLKKPMTERAVELLVMRLDKLQQEGHSPKELLEKSIMSSWLDVYPNRNDGEDKPRGKRL